MNEKPCLLFGEKFNFQIAKKQYIYDCRDAFNLLLTCKYSILCHFLQSNHFAFDSMLYDASTKTLVMIQITIDENHQIYYEDIVSFIKGETLKKTKGGDYYKKYREFFKDLQNSSLVDKYVYQWMTDRVYQKLIDKSNKARKDLGEKANLLEIIEYDKNLIRQIEKAYEI